MPTTYTMRFLASLLVLLAFLLPAGLHAQTEAESGEEVIEFQHKERPKRKVEIRKNDQILYPTKESNYLLEEKGDVIAWGDSTITVKEVNTGEKVEVNLNQSPYIRLYKRGKRIGGWILTGLGIAYTAIVVAFAIIAIAAGAIPGIFVLLLFAGIFLNPTNYIFFGIGLALLLTSRKKLDRFSWTWRRLRRIIVRRKSG